MHNSNEDMEFNNELLDQIIKSAESLKAIAMKNRKLYNSFLFLLSLLMCPQQLNAQKLKDFQEAMKTPRESGKGYVLSKRYNDVKVRKVASENGFKIVGLNYKGCAMFVPLDEYDTYKFEVDGYDYMNYFTQGLARAHDLQKSVSYDVITSLNHYVAISESERVNKDLKGTDFKTKGKAYFFEDDHFVLYDNVFWTGGVKNGMIDGRGDGFVVRKDKSDENEYRSISGEFKNGFPKGNVIYARGLPEVKKGWGSSYLTVSKETVEVGDMCESLAKYKIASQRNSFYGYVDNQGKIVIRPSYKEAKDFVNGLAYVIPEKIEVKIDKTGRVVAISENAKMSFDDMVSMKERYPHLAQSIEPIASKYVEGQLSYSEFVKAEKAFPNLSDKIYPRKLSIYKSDCKRLQEIYQIVQVSANEKKANKDGSQFVDNFISQYIYNDKFDPDKIETLALDLSDYYSVCDAMNVSVRSTYFEYNGRVPYFYSHGDRDKYTLSHAKDICSRSASSKFNNFFTFVSPSIISNYNEITQKLSRDHRIYDAAYSEYQAEEKRKEAERQEKLALLKSIDATTVYMYVKRQDDNWSEGRFFDSDTNYTDHKEVVFVDIEDKGKTFVSILYKKKGIKNMVLWWRK